MSEEQENLRREFCLTAIRLIEAKLARGHLDKKKGRRLLAKIERAFAELFVKDISSMEFVYRDMCVDVWPYWLIAGQPKTMAKAQAKQWMAEHGLAWTGSTQELRDAVRKALAKGETVPDGYFGLHVERTVKIRKREELNSHLPPEQSYSNPQMPPFIWVRRKTDSIARGPLIESSD